MGRGVDRVPEQGALAGGPALAGAGDVAEPGRTRVGEHALGECLDVEAEDRDAGVAGLDPVEHPRQGVVVGEASPAGLGGGRRADRLEGRGDPDVGKIGDEHRAGAGGAQRGHGLADRGGGSPARGVRTGGEAGRQQVVAAGPDGVQGARVGAPAPFGQVAAHLRAQLVRPAHGAGAADSVVGAAGARGPQREAEALGEVLDPYRAVGEAAGVAGVGQAVAERDQRGEALGHGGCGAREHPGQEHRLEDSASVHATATGAAAGRSRATAALSVQVAPAG